MFFFSQDPDLGCFLDPGHGGQKVRIRNTAGRLPVLYRIGIHVLDLIKGGDAGAGSGHGGRQGIQGLHQSRIPGQTGFLHTVQKGVLKIYQIFISGSIILPRVAHESLGK